MHPRSFPSVAALGFSLLSLSALAADLSPDQLLNKAQAEQKAYLATVKELVDVDTGTGQAPGLKTVSALLVERLKALGARSQRRLRPPRPVTTLSAHSRATAPDPFC